MAMPSSQTMNYSQLCDDIVRAIWMRSQSEMVPEKRPVMPVKLFNAAIKGDRNYIDGLIQRLGVQLKRQEEVLVNIEDTHSAPDEINPEIVQSELHSATCFGDTILHLLITEGHNDLALKVFECDESLLKARNNMLETPVYCAVKVGNTDVIKKLIETNCAAVKNVVAKTNKNGHTALHAAIIKGYTAMVQSMLKVDPNLACTPFLNGMFPIHEAARMGHLELVIHFMEKYPGDAQLRDPYHGRNFFHIAVENNKQEFFNNAAMEKKLKELVGEEDLRLQQWRKMMITAKNYEGNTPFHIAAMEGNREIMRAIWEHFKDDFTLLQWMITAKNSEGNTPFHIAAMEGNKEIMRAIWEHFKDDFTLLQWMITAKNYEGNTPFYIAELVGEDNLILQQWKEIMREMREMMITEQDFFNNAALEEKFKELVTEDNSRLQQWKKIMREMREMMITATNYEENTPFHIAAMEGNREIMRGIWEDFKDPDHTLYKMRNKQGYTPFNLSAKQVVKTNKDIDNGMIIRYQKTKGDIFSKKWFNVFMEPPLENKWERTQVIGLGSVLITTVTFAAAFTIPGSYNQYHGTPVLGRKYIFRAFILANALAFIQGFLSLFALLLETLRGVSDNAIVFATMSFLVAAGSMVVAFGLWMYVILASVCLPIATLLLVITLFLGTPAVILVVKLLNFILGPTMNSNRVAGFFYLFGFYVISFLFIFCVALV